MVIINHQNNYSTCLFNVLLSNLRKLVLTLFSAHTYLFTGLSTTKLHSQWPLPSSTKGKKYKVLWTFHFNNYETYYVQCAMLRDLKMS